MKTPLLLLGFVFTLILTIFYSCTKDIGINPLLAYSDKALLDSAKNKSAFVYYKDSPLAIYSGSFGAHGPFKLKFNKIANAALTDSGKLPVGQQFPNGSYIVKEVQLNNIYAVMYKKEGSWLWAEFTDDGSIIHSVTKDASKTCVNCHSQTGQRDLVMSFNFY